MNKTASFTIKILGLSPKDTGIVLRRLGYRGGVTQKIAKEAKARICAGELDSWFIERLAGPLDYEACGECGFDHSYEPTEAHQAHQG